MSLRSRPPAGVALCVLLLAAGPTRAIDCATVNGNLVPNCGFEEGLTGWSSSTTLQLSNAGETGSGGSFDNNAPLGNGQLSSPCVLLPAVDELRVGIVVTALSDFGNCELNVLQYADENCAAWYSGPIIGPPELVFPGAFTSLDGTVEVSPGALSARLFLSCFTDITIEFVADNGYMTGPVSVLEVPLSPAGLAALAVALALAGLFALRLPRG